MGTLHRYLVFARRRGVRVTVGDTSKVYEGRTLSVHEGLELAFQELPKEERSDWEARRWDQQGRTDFSSAAHLWAKNCGVSATEVREWVGHWQRSAGDWEAVAVDGSWRYGLPLDDVATALDRLAAEGWQVVHVSEDSGLYAGEDAADESSPTRARFLLRREE